MDFGKARLLAHGVQDKLRDGRLCVLGRLFCRLILVERLVHRFFFVVQCDVKRRPPFRALGAAVGDGLMYIGQDDRAAVVLVVIVAVQRAQRVPQGARRDAADGHDIGQQADDNQDDRADARKGPAQHAVQAARDEAAGLQFGPVAQQAEHGQAARGIVRPAEKGVGQGAQKDRQAGNGRAAQAHRPAPPREQQGAQAEQDGRAQVQAPAEQAAQGGVDEAQHHAVIFEDGDQAQHTQHAVDRGPRLARDAAGLLGVGRRDLRTALLLLHFGQLARAARRAGRPLAARRLVLGGRRLFLLALSHGPPPVCGRGTSGTHAYSCDSSVFSRL